MFYKTPVILCFRVVGLAVLVAREAQQRLHGRALIVGHGAGGRGVVVDACPLCAAAGVRRGMGLSRARRLMPRAAVVPPDARATARMSGRLLEFLRQRAPCVERSREDVFYLDITGCERAFGGDLLRWAADLTRAAHIHFHLTATVALATDRDAAGVAAALARPGRVLLVPPGAEADFLAPVHLRLLVGVGTAGRQRLRECGVRTFGDLATLPPEALAAMFGATPAETMRARARGAFARPVVASGLHRAIVHEEVLATDTASPAALSAAASRLAVRLSASLRAQALETSRATLTLRYSDGLERHRALDLLGPTSHEFTLGPAAAAAARQAHDRRVRVRSIALRAPFRQDDTGQMDLLDEERRQRTRRLLRAIDTVRQRHGTTAMGTGSGLDETDPPPWRPPP